MPFWLMILFNSFYWLVILTTGNNQEKSENIVLSDVLTILEKPMVEEQVKMICQKEIWCETTAGLLVLCKGDFFSIFDIQSPPFVEW
jgi:hypothetical protein